MSALGHKQTFALSGPLYPRKRTFADTAEMLSANTSGGVKRAFENVLFAEESLVTRPNYCLVRQWSSRNLLARPAFRAETGLVGSRRVHHRCLSRSDLSSLAAAFGLSFPGPEFGYGQCCIRVCLYLNPPPAPKSQNWRYRLGRSRCMQNAFVALARYRDNMERTHRFQSELPKAIAKTIAVPQVGRAASNRRAYATSAMSALQACLVLSELQFNRRKAGKA